MNINLSEFVMFVLIVLANRMAFSQNRNVVCVHGFGDDFSAWEHYATIFSNERKINSTRQSYPTANGLTTAANALRNTVPDAASTNLGIGHSLGGLMIREVDRVPGAGGNKFGGYITLATPNYGAPVATSVLSGNVQSAISTAISQLVAGPLSEMPAFGLPWIILPGASEYTTDWVANQLAKLINITTNATYTDMQTGSAAMDNLLHFSSTANRIAIVAEETSPVHWRLLGSMMNRGQSNGQPNDENLLAIMNQIREVYNSLYINHQALAIGLGDMIPFLGFHSNAAAQWKKGQDWMDNSETIWCSLIKTTGTVKMHITDLVWQPCLPLPNSPFLPSPDCGTWLQVDTYDYVTQSTKSDGLLPTYAQELQDIPAGNRYLIDHANHIELLDMSYSKNQNGTLDDGTKVTLNAIFNRNDWFNTPK